MVAGHLDHARAAQPIARVLQAAGKVQPVVGPDQQRGIVLLVDEELWLGRAIERTEVRILVLRARMLASVSCAIPSD
jgi:hypothetical protein